MVFCFRPRPGCRASVAQISIAAAQAFLRLSCKGLHPFRDRLELRIEMPGLAGREAVIRGGFHQDAPDVAVAGAPPRSRGVLAWNQSEETHQLPVIVEAGDVTQFGDAPGRLTAGLDISR